MDELNSLDRFDLGTRGDRHEQEFWPMLSARFPSYEILWRRLIVPLTFRIDQRAAAVDPRKWIRFRPGIPEKYEQMAMAHYSVFYFLGRAVKCVSQDGTAFEYPEDVFFLLDCVGDNFECFLNTMNSIGADSGLEVFDSGLIAQFPMGFGPFEEIQAYRDVLLHNPVIGRAMDVDKTYIPKWEVDKRKSPLERAKRLWRDAEALSPNDLVSTRDLLERLLPETCLLLENHWGRALAMVERLPFQEKMVKVLNLKEYSVAR